VLSHGEVTVHRPAAELAADRELVLAGYLGDHAQDGRAQDGRAQDGRAQDGRAPEGDQ